MFKCEWRQYLVTISMYICTNPYEREKPCNSPCWRLTAPKIMVSPHFGYPDIYREFMIKKGDPKVAEEIINNSILRVLVLDSSEQEIFEARTTSRYHKEGNQILHKIVREANGDIELVRETYEIREIIKINTKTKTILYQYDFWSASPNAKCLYSAVYTYF